MGKEIIYIEYLNKDKKFALDKKQFKGSDALEKAIFWGENNFEKFNMDMIKHKSFNLEKSKDKWFLKSNK